MAKKVFDMKFGQRRIVSFDNGVQLTGGNKSISTILDIIDKIGKVLQKEEKRGRNKGCDRVRKAAPEPGRKSNAVPKMQGRVRSKRPSA